MRDSGERSSTRCSLNVPKCRIRLPSFGLFQLCRNTPEDGGYPEPNTLFSIPIRTQFRPRSWHPSNPSKSPYPPFSRPPTWLVLIRPSGTWMMWRRVLHAIALMRLVFPVPGGPWSSSPSLWG